jgi:hypothetical protein
VGHGADGVWRVLFDSISPGKSLKLLERGMLSAEAQRYG